MKLISAKGVSNRWFPDPKILCATFSRRMETPIVLIREARCEAPGRPRSGRRANRSSSSPIAAVTTMAPRNATGSGAPALLTMSMPTNAPNMKISPWAMLMMSSTPKTSVYPSATMA